jgi:histidyl-tRNA synthetase
LQTEGVEFVKPGITAFVVPVSDSVRTKAFQVVSDLRRSGILADVDLMRRGVGKSLKYAATVPSKFAVIVGEKELESESVTVRNMHSGEQSLVKIDDLVNVLRI